MAAYGTQQTVSPPPKPAYAYVAWTRPAVSYGVVYHPGLEAEPDTPPPTWGQLYP